MSKIVECVPNFSEGIRTDVSSHFSQVEYQ